MRKGTSKYLPYAGSKLNNLLLIGPSETGRGEWNAICDCGKSISVDPGRVIRGIIQSCGCAHYTHGKNRKDYTGVVAYSLTMMKPCDIQDEQEKSILWDAQCMCGNIITVIPGTAIRGEIKNCGCKRFRSIPKDYTGQKFRKLTFIRPVWDVEKGKTIWELQCDCGNLTTAAAYHVVSGAIRSCGCFLKEVLQKRRIYEPIMSSAHEVFNRSYKDQGLDFDTFFQLSQQNCFYCGSAPHRTFNISKRRYKKPNPLADFTYNGLDRVDSSRGHSEDNVVTCCWTCNYMKRTSTLEEFDKQIKSIYRSLIKREVKQEPLTNELLMIEISRLEII